MTFLALLAFAFLVGICQSQEEPDYDYEPDNDGSYDDMKPDFLTLIKQTALGKEISDKVSESLDDIRKYTSDLGNKAGNMLVGTIRGIIQEGEQYESQVSRHVEQKAQVLAPRAEAYATEVQGKINDTLQDIQAKTIVIVQDFHSQLTQSAGTIRKKTESFVESVAQIMQSQIASFWESLTKGNWIYRLLSVPRWPSTGPNCPHTKEMKAYQ